MRRCASPGALLAGLSIGCTALFFGPAGGQAASPAKIALVYGDGYSVIAPAIRGAGGVPLRELEGRRLSEISVVVLANIPFHAIPQHVSGHLREFVARGGGLLITGGAESFGSGGYQAIADLVPFLIRGPGDFVARPFKPPVPLLPDHPALAGGRFTTVGHFNDMNPKQGATELLQYPGGFVPNVEVGSATFRSPLMAEQRVGSGRVLGIAFDISEVAPRSPEGQALLNSIVRYLLTQSVIPVPKDIGQQ